MKVFLGPQDVAGQTAALSRALRDIGIKAISVSYINPRGFLVDKFLSNKTLPENKLLRLISKSSMALKMSRYLFSYDVYHFLMMNSLFKRNHLDLPVLQLLKKKILMEMCGDEVRIPPIAIKKNPYIKYYYETKDVYFYTECAGNIDFLIQRMKYVSKYIKTITVADHELYEYVMPYFNRVEFVKQPIDLSRMKPVYPDKNNKKPVIAHAPSKKNQKGTSFVIQAVDNLKRKGLEFEFVTPQRLLSQVEAWDFMSKADIVIDQLLLGTHGSQSLEVMALGKPVICYIRDDLVEKYPKDMPIFNANPDNIEEKLELLIKNPEIRHELGVKSRQYVEKYHDSVKIAKQLIEIYKTL